MSQKYRDKYIDLKINGRLFPSFIVENFKDYILDEIVLDEKEDPCFKSGNHELSKYQAFASKYLDFNSPYKTMLLYHQLGAGKTFTLINIYNMLYNYTPGWNVFILLPASLKFNWEGELNKFLEKEDKNARMSNIKFISYNASNAEKAFIEAIQNSDASKKNFFVIEEAHNFISNVYSNISSKKGRRAQTIYDYIIQDQIENHDTRVVLLSATPAINIPFELALLFNLLRPGIFPKSETQFNQEFISQTNFRSINPIRKNMFQRRIMGLVSYYIGSTPDYFASKKVEYIYVKMSKYQEEIYGYFEEMEGRMKAKKRKGQSGSETYMSYTRQACNFVFPFLQDGMSGETRPRPKNFAISEKVGNQLLEGKLEKDNEKYYDAQNYFNALEKYVELFDKSLEMLAQEDVKNKHTIFDDMQTFKEKYNSNYPEFDAKEGKKSKVYKELYKCSAKMLYVIFVIFTSPGPVLVYSNYVLMEGIQIFKIYLKQFGFTGIKLEDTEKHGKNHFRYMEFHGGIDKETRKKSLEIYNKIENKHGNLCKIIMISPAGAEGLNLFNVRQVHLLEPYWHEVRMNQMIGRAIRRCGHKFLPKDERHVDVYRYKSVREDYPKAKWTTDQKIEDMARGKEGLIQSFLDSVKEVAVDCTLFKKHNTLTQDYKCFQFEEKSLFDEQIGPAYKDDMHEDMRLNNGSNSINAKTMRIKVMKIKAVKQLDKEGKEFSEPQNYWYYQESGVVYDYELLYAIGKIAYSNNDIPMKLNADTYIIDKLLPIPLIKSGR